MYDRVAAVKRDLRQKFDRDIELVRKVLRRWDPIGLSHGRGGDPAVDEYDGYAPQILSLLYRSASQKVIPSHLEILRTEQMGMPPLRSRDEDIAEELQALSLVPEPHHLVSAKEPLPKDFPSPVHARLAADVRAYGWHVMKVLPEDNNPGWAYSIGLYHTFHQPDII
ncbi:MAG: DUF4262 domain-containing protein, partial [Acidobacteriaceae bacterium]|nr:DUF4262 domain-containing protein [Acidobacteriaceae bacterium]